MAILNNSFELINKVSKMKDQPGPFVLLSLWEGHCVSVPQGCSHSLIVFLPTAFVARKVK